MVPLEGDTDSSEGSSEPNWRHRLQGRRLGGRRIWLGVVHWCRAGAKHGLQARCCIEVRLRNRYFDWRLRTVNLFPWDPGPASVDFYSDGWHRGRLDEIRCCSCYKRVADRW